MAIIEILASPQSKDQPPSGVATPNEEQTPAAPVADPHKPGLPPAQQEPPPPRVYSGNGVGAGGGTDVAVNFRTLQAASYDGQNHPGMKDHRRPTRSGTSSRLIPVFSLGNA